MIINSTIDSTVTNITNSSNMGVIADGRMFKLLLNNLYSQPVAAILRELSCNAIDAHVSVGNLNPFHMQLPTLLNSNFVIRDFGPGLDEEEINLYLNTLFSSSKTQSNDFIGSFGLGSKVAFSLVSSFNIESYKDGTKYTCLWYEKECGTPTLIVTSRAPTEEPNGLKFIVPLSDIDNKNNYPEEFLSTVKKNLFNLPIKPRFFYEIDNPETEYTIEYSCELSKFYPEYNISIFNTFGNYNCRFIYVNIGGIIYQSSVRLDYDFIQYILESHPYNKILVVDVPIGELTLPMNREEIENTPQNIATIGKYYNTEIQNAILEGYFTNVKAVIESDDFTYSALQEVLQLPSLSAYQLNRRIPPNILQLIKPLKVSDIDLHALSQSYRREKLKTLSHFYVKSHYPDIFNTLAENNLLVLNRIKPDYTRTSNKSTHLFLNNWEFKKLYIIYQDYSKEKPTTYSAYSIENYFKQNNYDINGSDNHVAVYITFNNSLVLDYLKDFFSLINSQFNNETVFIDYNTVPRVKNPKTPSTPRVSDSFIFNVKYLTISLKYFNFHNKLDKSSLVSFKKSVLTSTTGIKPFTLQNYFGHSNIKTVVLINSSLYSSVGTDKLKNILFNLLKINDVETEEVLLITYLTQKKQQEVMNLLSNEPNVNFYVLDTEEKFLSVDYELNSKYIDNHLNTQDVSSFAHYYYNYFNFIFMSCFYFNVKNHTNLIRVFFKYLETLYKITDSNTIILTKEDDELIREHLEHFFDYFNKINSYQFSSYSKNQAMDSFISICDSYKTNCQKVIKYNFKETFINLLVNTGALNYNVADTINIPNDSALTEIRDQFLKKFNFTR